jgi:hypothetical protein
MYMLQHVEPRQNLLKIDTCSFALHGGIVRSTFPENIHFRMNIITIDYMNLGVLRAEHECLTNEGVASTGINFELNGIHGI